MRLLVAVFGLFLPWRLRRLTLIHFLGFDIDPKSRIGFSVVLPKEGLVMAEGAIIGHLNMIWNLDRVTVDRNARIGHMNWISALVRGGEGKRFDAYPDRRPELRLGECAGITQRHYIDASDAITLEPFSLVGGVRSTLLCHHMNVQRGRQGCGPIRVGAYSMVSTNCVLLGGAQLPDHSVLGARSLMLADGGDAYRLYVGSPATQVKEYPHDLGWFQRTSRQTF